MPMFFPGGQVEKSDEGDIRRAALRELYEEVRLHLRPALVGGADSEKPKRVVPQAVNGDIPFSRFLEENKGPTAEESLVRYARWITPKMMPKRFDTHFFLGVCSKLDNPVDGRVDGQEIKSLAWLTPGEALQRFSDGKITLFPPQWYSLNPTNAVLTPGISLAISIRIHPLYQVSYHYVIVSLNRHSQWPHRESKSKAEISSQFASTATKTINPAMTNQNLDQAADIASTSKWSPEDPNRFPSRSKTSISPQNYNTRARA